MFSAARSLDGKDIRTIELQDLTAASSASCCRIRSCSPAQSKQTSVSAHRILTAATVNVLSKKLGWEIRPLAAQGVASSVNERGSTLLGGQRQLIQFCRALGAQSALLDSRRSHLGVDTKTELLIREALNRLLSGRTAPRDCSSLSTIQHGIAFWYSTKGDCASRARIRSFSPNAAFTTAVSVAVQRAGVASPHGSHGIAEPSRFRQATEAGENPNATHPLLLSPAKLRETCTPRGSDRFEATPRRCDFRYGRAADACRRC